VNVDDRDAGQYLRFFTLLPRAEIESLEAALAAQPEKREAQYALARDVTRRVHGDDALAATEEATSILFGGGDVSGATPRAFEVLRDEIPFFPLSVEGKPQLQHILDAVSQGPQALFKSKGEARRAIAQGGFYVNNQRVSPDQSLQQEVELIGGRFVLVRKGARSYALIEFAAS
jgi:tyrosyl-tRNA synthetase